MKPIPSTRSRRLTTAMLVAAGFSLVPVTISSTGQVEEAGACASGLECRFELGSVCDTTGDFDYYETGVEVVGD